MALKPGDNDVLSGRGAWFNQHPGNEHFRQMLIEQKDVYMAGTKKQKMDMSKAIVEAIYLKDPPGRFLKQCPKSCQWNELSKREAADRVAQAMAYAVRGKDTSKRKREELQRSRRISHQRPKCNDGAAVTSSRHAGDRTTTRRHLHSSSNQLEDSAPSWSSVANQKRTARRPVAGDTNNTAAAKSATMKIGVTDSATDEMPLAPGNNSTFFQQLQSSPPQMNQSSDAAILPTSSIDQRVTQNGLVQVLAQAVQQQRRHHGQQHDQQQQQQLLQSNLLPNPLGQLLHTQTQPQPASLEGLAHQLLAQVQQQQQQQQQHLQHFILLQHLLNVQNVLPTDSLATLPPSAPASASPGLLPTNNDMILNGASSASNHPLNFQSHQAANTNMNILQSLQQQSNPSSNSNALLLNSLLSNLQHQPNTVGIINALQRVQQLDQLQRSLRVHHSQQLPSSLPTASNQSSRQQQQQQQQSLLLNSLHQAWQIALLLQIQNSQDHPPSIAAQPSANAASASTRQDESGVDEGQNMPEEEPT